MIDLFGLSATPEDMAVFDLRRARQSKNPALPFAKGHGERKKETGDK